MGRLGAITDRVIRRVESWDDWAEMIAFRVVSQQ